MTPTGVCKPAVTYPSRTRLAASTKAIAVHVSLFTVCKAARLTVSSAFVRTTVAWYGLASPCSGARRGGSASRSSEGNAVPATCTKVLTSGAPVDRGSVRGEELADNSMIKKMMMS